MVIKSPTILKAMVGLNATQRKSIGAGPYSPRQRLTGEALPNTISYRTQPVYVPEKLAPARANADHHMMFKSRVS